MKSIKKIKSPASAYLVDIHFYNHDTLSIGLSDETFLEFQNWMKGENQTSEYKFTFGNDEYVINREHIEKVTHYPNTKKYIVFRYLSSPLSIKASNFLSYKNYFAVLICAFFVSFLAQHPQVLTSNTNVFMRLRDFFQSLIITLKFQYFEKLFISLCLIDIVIKLISKILLFKLINRHQPILIRNHCDAREYAFINLLFIHIITWFFSSVVYSFLA